MNRLEATVDDGTSGAVTWSGQRLTDRRCAGPAEGDRVLVLVRPEALSSGRRR